MHQAELLLHFTTTTAPTLGGCDCPHQLAFWTRNVPHIGLSHPFVLHLLLAAASFHLAYLAKHHTTTDTAVDNATASALPLRLMRVEYLALAQQHLTAGVSGFSAQLARPAPENCGALYLGAVLTCYCTFADGPAGRDDLLVCTVKGEEHGGGGSHDDGSDRGEDASPATTGTSSSSSPAVSMPFVYGVRLMHESFSPDVLFAGPMEPLARAPRPPALEEPVCVRDGFPRLEWEAQLDGLREFVVAARCAASDGRDGATPASTEATRATAAVSLKALDNLIGIYAAIYGRRGQNGEITLVGPSENQFVFGWLYRLEPEFAACVRRCEPCALLALAHYALLLKGDAVPRGWYVEGWKEHIVARIGELLGDAEGNLIMDQMKTKSQTGGLLDYFVAPKPQ
ncbi:hypothetical protein NEMBOFW57_009429 [Staphylotrichum longicolle]|uniref:Uncharacterized protein n=1 Tax=Staphylotrichum longicolle TaxID=669026 RepID=A0AAD4EPD3_9PEZI|nr:hypothetical protein NEMBOFW57_009429 [Staphylotrichum longicolle]